MPGLPGRGGGDGRARRGDVRLEAAVLTRAAGGEVEQLVRRTGHRAVVGQPGLLADPGGDADHVVGDRRVADGVDAGAGVAGRDEHLHAVVVDQPVVELGAGVVAVVERGQAADRHVDDVDVAVDDQVDHAVGERGVGAAAAPGAGPGGDDLRARGGAVEVGVAEQVVGGGDAGDVRAVLGLDDADVDEVGGAGQPDRGGVDVLAVLDDERHLLADRGGRVVGAEVADLVAVLVRPHHRVVGEVAVLVEVDPDVVARRVVEDAEQVGGVAVAVDVAAGSPPAVMDSANWLIR